MTETTDTRIAPGQLWYYDVGNSYASIDLVIALNDDEDEAMVYELWSSGEKGCAQLSIKEMSGSIDRGHYALLEDA